MANILQIAVPTGPAALCWPARSDPAVQSLLFINQDLTHVIYIGQISSITAASPNTIPIPPNGTFSGDASSPWYVIGASSGILPVVMVPNGQAYFRGLTQASGQLALPEFQSPNYVPGSAGWAVFQNGFAEFSNVVVRGTIIAGQFIGTGEGEEILIYSGTPAANNLIMAMVSANFTDSNGNQGFTGFNVLTPFSAGSARLMNIAGGAGQNTGTFYYHSTVGQNSWVQGSFIAPQSGNDLTVGSDITTLQPISAGLTPQIFGSPGIQLNPWTEYINQSSAPAATANAIAFADSLGALHTKDGTDGNTYSLQRMTPVLFSDTASLTALTTVFSFAGGIRTYVMHGRFYCTPVLNAQLSMEVVAPAGATGLMSVEIKRATTWFGGVAGSINAVNSVLVNLPAASGYLIDFHCTLHLTAAGTVSIQCGSATANALVINAFSELDIYPT